MKQIDIATIWGYRLSPGQVKIIGSIANDDIKRLIVLAPTRYGKTRSASIGALLYLIQHPQCKIALIAPTRNQTGVLRNYISEFVSSVSILRKLVDTPNSADISRLKKEASKKRVTFRDNREIKTFTAHGEGKGLMGFGADLILLDEAVLIDDEVYRSKISRMLGDSPDSKLVELVNPWHRQNFSWRHYTSPLFTKIHIDYRQALREGRITQEFLDEQHNELTEYEFTVLYESKFPEESEDSLLKYGWITRAENNTINMVNPQHFWGLDVAEGGVDLNVLTHSLIEGDRVKMVNQWDWSEADTMKTVGRTLHLIENQPVDEIRVDKIGIGKGVADRLAEQDLPVIQVHVGESPQQERDRFSNLKAQGYMNLRKLFERNKISIIGSQKLVGQLAMMKKKFNSRGKMVIIDPDKSPDFADSLMLSCLNLKKRKVTTTTIDNPFL